MQRKLTEGKGEAEKACSCSSTSTTQITIAGDKSKEWDINLHEFNTYIGKLHIYVWMKYWIGYRNRQISALIYLCIGKSAFSVSVQLWD